MSQTITPNRATNPVSAPSAAFHHIPADIRPLAGVIAGSLLLAASAQVSVSMLPLSPVPVTGQTLAVLLLGVLLTPRLAAAAVALYLVQGAAGLPVFAGGGAGAHHLLGPTAGYLWAFLPAAWFVALAHAAGYTRHAMGALAIFTGATAVIFAGGLVWLAILASSIGLERSLPAILSAGLWPYLPGAAVKCLAALAFLPRQRPRNPATA